MKELVVISGKGGTGKTSLVAAFATLAAPCVTADCDVDAADLHLVLDPDVRTTHPFIGGRQAEVRADACTGCGTCEDICRFEAIALVEDQGRTVARVDPILCEGCSACVRFCPESCIDFEEQQEGEWYESASRFGPLVHARLNLAGEASGKLVTVVRNRAKEVAEETGHDLVILDGSPGIGCPVIASVVGADLVLAVSEPTLSGLHDLERVQALATHFQVPLLACINKHDLNPVVAGQIAAFLASRNVPLAGRIPYHTDFVASQVRGQSVTEYGGPAAEAVDALWHTVERHLEDREEVPSPARGAEEDRETDKEGA